MERLSILPRHKSRPIWIHWAQNNLIQGHADDGIEDRVGRSAAGDRKIRSETVKVIVARHGT